MLLHGGVLSESLPAELTISEERFMIISFEKCFLPAIRSFASVRPFVLFEGLATREQLAATGPIAAELYYSWGASFSFFFCSLRKIVI